MRVIDLSVIVNEQTPVYPGDPATKITEAGVITRDGYEDHYVSFGTHVGTHIDAPSHMVPHGRSLDEVPINTFVGRGRYVNVASGGFELVKDAGIEAGDIVLFHTGMDSKYYATEYFENYPVMTNDVAQYLVDVGVKVVGVDACSVDDQDGFPLHKTLLGGGVLIIENLTNLGELKGKEFDIYALPIRLALDGAPARVIAQFKTD